MPNQVLNVAKGRVNQFFHNVADGAPANSAIVVVLLKVAEADAALLDYDTLAALLGAAGNTEADFTNYARKELTGVSGGTVDDVNDWVDCFIGDQVWTAAGGTLDNSLVKLLVCYNPDTVGGSDTGIIPCTHHDFVATTNGEDLKAAEGPDGMFRAKEPA